MKVSVVTGASGHLGANLVRALIAAGEGPVRCLVRSNVSGLDGLDVELVRGDVLDPASLRAAFGGAEVVYHLAALITLSRTAAPRAWRVNVEGARNAAMAALHAGVRRFVHFSSVHSFDVAGAGAVLDERAPRAHGAHRAPYDRSKAAGEAAVRAVVAEGLDAVVLHPTAVLGPWDFGPSAMGRVIRELATGRMPAVVPGGFDWVDARDVASGAMLAARSGRRGESYLLGGTWATVRQLAELVSLASGVAPPRWTAPLWLLRRVAPPWERLARAVGVTPRLTAESVEVLQSRRVDSGKAICQLGYTRRPLRDTVAATCRWFDARARG